MRYQPPTFSAFAGLTTKKSYTPPTLFASGSVKAYAGAQLGLKLYAAAGPYLRMNGYAKLAADTRKTPWWTLKAGIEARMGAQIGVNGGFIHWNKDWKTRQPDTWSSGRWRRRRRRGRHQVPVNRSA